MNTGLISVREMLRFTESFQRTYQLEEKLQITLALSLHATTDEKRRRLMPIANKYHMEELMACAAIILKKPEGG